jgi:hypothetical protein
MADLSNDLSYSFSRINSFEMCKRKYFYQYYYFWNGWLSNADPNIQEAYFCKTLDGINPYIGNLVHEFISKRLRDLILKNELIVNQTALYNEIKERVEKRYSYSVNNLRNKNFQKILSENIKIKDLGFREHYFGDISEDDDQYVIEYMTQKSVIAISSLEKMGFFNIEVKKSLLSGREKELCNYVEPPQMNFDDLYLHDYNGKEIKCFLNPDLYFEIEGNPNKIIIIDWKTGLEPTNKRLGLLNNQLKLYALKVAKESAIDCNNRKQIEAYEVYLPSGIMKGGEVTANHLSEIEEKIHQDIFKLSTVLIDENIENNQPQNPIHFEKTDKLKVCSFCNYEGICND